MGALLGEITVDRGGFAVRNRKNGVIGVITPAMNGSSPVGTIEGRFPKNGFGIN